MYAPLSAAEQAKLTQGSALVVGAGGLGSPIAYQLAAAGVGRVGLCDMDRVDYSNLQRQVLHYTSDVGLFKVDSGADKMRGLNPEIQVETHPVALTRETALPLFAQYDIVLDGSDNFATRYLVNDACVLTGKTQVHGSIFRFDGQISVFQPGQGPCYRCLYPEPPPPGTVPSCAQAGVIGVLPGLIGSLMAMEAIKLLTGRGRTLVGRLLIYDSIGMEIAEMRLRQNPDCRVCGANPSITELVDYVALCGGLEG